MNRHIPLVASLVAAAAAAQDIASIQRPAHAEEHLAQEEYPGVWNQWRGPNRSGHLTGVAWPKRLQKSNFVKQWRVDAGPSYSGPIVSKSLVFTTATVDKQTEVVRALDRRTGEQVWKTEWKGAIRVPFFARNGSWIRSTPAFDGDSVYVAGMRDVLVCLASRDGETRWKVDFTERFGSNLESFGFVCSPLVDGDFVYVQCGAGLVKLDKATGKTAWLSMKDRGGMFGGAFSSPVIAEIRGTRQLLVQSRTSLNGVALPDGKVLWTMPVKSFRGMNILTPVAHGDAVFTSAYGGRGHMFAVDKVGDGEAVMAVEEKWTSRAQAYMTSPVVIDGHAYLYLRSKRFCCVDLADGKLKWTSKPMGNTYWSLVANGERMLALTDDGKIHLIAANTERLEVLDTIEVSSGETWAHLSVDGPQVMVRDLEGLTAYLWQENESK